LLSKANKNKVDKPVEIAAPFAPKNGIKIKLPAKFIIVAERYITINQLVFFTKSIPLPTITSKDIMIGDKNKKGEIDAAGL